jgi:phosphopantothenoylcysteine decarboxylase/phosphopantothenate--cysteine ligase
MSAAVADFRPGENADTKIKKRDDGADPVITLVRNPDILAETVQNRSASGSGPSLIVGFAAETGDDSGSVLEYGRRKLERKGCDLLVLNQVGRALVFGQDSTEVRILSPKDDPAAEPPALTGSKAEIARHLVQRIAAELAGSPALHATS